MNGAHSTVRPGPFESWFIVASVAWLLLGPRIAVPGGLGVRYEDLLFLLIAVPALRTRARRRMLLRRENIGIVVLTAASLISTGFGVASGRVQPALSTLYSLRPLEYWIVYPVIVLLLAEQTVRWTNRVTALLAVITVLQTGFALAQYLFDVQIGFSHQAYSRGAGLTAGPYELGAISAALLIFWVVQRRLLLAAIATAGLLVSISRISLIGAAAGLVLVGVAALTKRIAIRRAEGAPRTRLRPSRRVVTTTTVIVVLGAVATILLITPWGSRTASTMAAPIVERFGSTSIQGSWDAADVLAARIPPITTAAQYNSVAFDHIFDHVDAQQAADVGAEASNLVRFFRWHLILNTINTPDRVLIGLGPSFVGGSVDGSYLRFFADGGLLGVLAWSVFIFGWVRRTPAWMVGVIVSLLVGAVFIDIVYALRAMVLFWTLLALARYGCPLSVAEPPLALIRSRRAARSRTLVLEEERR